MSDRKAYGWRSAEPPLSFAYLSSPIIEILKERGAQKMLDIGAGNGSLCAELVREGFDAVVPAEVIEHLSSPDLLPKFAAKLLGPGGHIKFWSRATLTQLLDRNGFDVVAFDGAGRVPYLWKSMIIVARRQAMREKRKRFPRSRDTGRREAPHIPSAGCGE